MNKNKELFQKDYWERDNLNKRRTPNHPVISAYVNSRIDILKRYVKIDEKTTLLDVGCVNGYFTYYFDKICDTTGVDYSEKLLENNPVKKKYLMDANNLQFADNSFDIVFAHAVLHHVDDIDKILREMRRVSKKYVVILDCNRNNPLFFVYSLIVKEEAKIIDFSLNYLRKKMIKTGLDISNSFSYGLLFPNKTPTIMAPLVKMIDFKHPLGITNIIIGEKNSN